MELTVPTPRAFAAPGNVIALEQRAVAASAPIQVLVAYGDMLMRAGVRALLEREPDIAVAAEAASGEDAVALAGELSPEVILMDITLPGLDACEATRRILAGAQRAQPKVLILGWCKSDEQLFAALRAGASGFLLSDTDPGELPRAVRSVTQGHALLSPSITRRLVDEFAAQPDTSRPSPERLLELTKREREVMALVAIGLSNSEIAARIVVSPATAKTHVSRAMRKLCARDRAQLVALAYQTRLVEPRRAQDGGAPPTLQAA
jgi:DNA-binding NarL/FixJ family response regulator